MTARALLLLLLLTAACARPPQPSAPPSATSADTLAIAQQRELRDALSPQSYLMALGDAVATPHDPLSLPVALAAIDALVFREVRGLAPGTEHAIAQRSADGLARTAYDLRYTWHRAAASPLVRGLIADALHHLAMRVGDADAAIKWRRRAGCPATATVIGPVGFPPLSRVGVASVVPAHEALPGSFKGLAPFATTVSPEIVFADKCAINVNEVSPLRGVRAVVIDVDNPREQELWLALGASSAAKVWIGGKPIVERSYDKGGSPTQHFARAKVQAGVVRIVVQLAQNHDGTLMSFQLWNAKGEALMPLAAQVGAVAPARALSVTRVDVTADGPATTNAAALLAVGDARGAAQLLETTEERSPLLSLLRLRAIEAARLIPQNQMTLSLEGTAESALEACGDCWELRVAAARMAQQRQGHGTGAYAALDKLGVAATGDAWRRELSPMELMFVAQTASAAGLADIARAAYDALEPTLRGSMALADLDVQLFRRLGQDRVDAACSGGTSRASTLCLQAHIARSDYRALFAELARLRRLRGTPAILRDIEMQQLLVRGDSESALRIYGALPPARRSLALLGVALGDDEATAQAKRLFAQDMLSAAGAPFGFEPLARLLGVVADPARRFDSEGAELVARDRDSAFLPGAGTAVLRRSERYDLEETGLLRWVIYDLRRVSGTIDVASGTWMGTPTVTGRSTSRVVRRRIFKQDGRVLDPDPTARGRQGSTELSQLQTGDYVEALIVGWTLPEASGQLVVDTPDVLPLRTSVRQGDITLSRPVSIDMKLWAHPLLGQGQTTTEGAVRQTVWSLRDQLPRRFEEGVPPLEARVAISFGTDSWQRIAQAVADRFRALDESDPFMVRWVQRAVGDAASEKDRVAALVAAVGKTIRRSDPSALGDFVATLGGGSQRETARWIIEKGAGSRSWVVHRSLRALGLQSEIAVSEARPFSAAPNFPPHPGRFTHPLVRVTIDGRPTWIDADVEGPPLPPGRVSPELRGRQALLANGQIITVDAHAADDIDKIVVRLALDEGGVASGTAKLALFGRPAQQLAEALETAVGSRRDELLRNAVLGWLPWADVQKTTLTSAAGGWELAIEADVKIVALARPESRDGKRFSLPGIAPLAPGVSATLARPPSSARYTSQADPHNGARHRSSRSCTGSRRSIELPPRAKVTKLAATRLRRCAGDACWTAERSIDHVAASKHRRGRST